MASTAKTVFLLGVMTGLLLLVGAFAGGRNGLVLSLAVSVGMNLVVWFFSDSMVIRSTGAVPVEPGELDWLLDEVQTLAQKASIPTPRLYWIPHEPSPNAFATGRNPGKGLVAVTRGLVEQLDRREVRGVLAHELGHIKHRDTLVSTVAASMAGAVSYFAMAARYGRNRRANPLVLVVLSLLAPLSATLIRLGISRTREYKADRRAADLTGDAEGLALALEGLSRGVQARPMQNDRARSVHFVVHGFVGGLSRLFSTHPPIAERVRRLRSYEPHPSP